MEMFKHATQLFRLNNASVSGSQLPEILSVPVALATLTDNEARQSHDLNQSFGDGRLPAGEVHTQMEFKPLCAKLPLALLPAATR